MDERRSSLSIVNDRTIGTKISVGFAVVLLVLAVSSTVAYFSFGQSTQAVEEYARLVFNSSIIRNIDLQVAIYRGHVREYVFSNDEATAALGKKDGETLHQLIAEGLTSITNPERHRLLEDTAKQAEIYSAAFGHAHAMNLEQTKLQNDVLDTAGKQMTDGFSVIIASAIKAENAELLSTAIEARRLSLSTQIGVAKRLGSHDEAAGKSAVEAFDGLRHGLSQIDSLTKGSDTNAAVAPLLKVVDAYQAAFLRSATLDSDQLTLLNGAMKQAGTAMSDDAVKAKESNLADQAATEAAAKAVIGSGETLVLWLGVIGLAIGVVLAWVIGRGIARPVVGMCAAMRALAGGNKAVEIPGVGRKDEIGQMADTVQVFKTNMIEADRLREESELHKADAEKERKTGMLRLADSFEAGIKGVVASVASQATEMQSSAEAMTHTAEQATQQATAVAASVEEASANVQTVAASTEELSSSVLEIGRQVEQSSKIANQAVIEADKTNATVEGLNKSAQRIGEVVQLIETIAGQTNLLALNATIEAARAGDAGKGFAVVASEVKSLANQTAKATEEIRSQIGDIQGATGQTVEAIRIIGATIRQMSEIATTIASAVEEQGAATREIATNVHQAAQGTSDIATNIEGVSRAASETGAAATQVLGAAGELSKQSEMLRHDVDQFLATVRAA